MGRKVFTNAFAGGEVSPLLFGHIEDEGYRTGFARGRNMLALPTGPAQKRPQFDFVHTAKPGTSPVRLFPFVYGDGDAYAMEWGPNHVRFHAEGTTLLYATPIPVASVDLTANTFTTVAPHGLTLETPVRITHKGVNIPGNLATGTTYYVNSIINTTTFTVSTTTPAGATVDLITNSTIDETSFWRQSQLPREYISSKNAVSINAGADSINIVGHSFVAGDAVHFTASIVFTADFTTDTFTANGHGMASGTPVTVSSSGTLPAGLSAGVTYYVLTPGPNTFQLSTTPGGITAVNILDNGTGVHTAVPTIVLASTPPIVTGTAYYVSIVDPDNFKVYTTKAAALAGTGQIDLPALGSSETLRCHFAYYQGDIVWGGSLTLLAGTSSRLFIVIDDLTTALPTVASWYQMPADGSYELSTTLGADALNALNYDQSLDVWTLTKPQSAAYTLGRETADAPSGSSATLAVTKFVFRRVDPSPGPPAPALSLTSRVFGENYAISVAASSSTFSAGGTTNHGLLPGDVVYIEGTLGASNAMTGVAGSPGFFLVTTTTTPPDNTFKIRNVNGGAEVTNSIASIENGALRVVGSSSRLTESYVVTAIRDGDESLASNVLTVTNSLDVPGSSNVLSWTAVAQAQRYRLYKLIDGAYGLVIETDQLTATDDGIGPDLEFQPPTFDQSLNTEYPRAVANFQQRIWLGGTDLHPRRVWGGKTGTVSTMSYHDHLLLDTDRIRFDVAAHERTLVKHIVASSQLWVMTSAAEIKITGRNTDVLSPVTGIDARPLSRIGCTGVRPIVANSNILFVSSRNGHVYELPSQTLQVVDPPDLSIRSAHLFDSYTLAQSAQQSAPNEIEWWIRSDGALLGLTYQPDQNIRGWHVHTAGGTNAMIESACVIPDSDGKRLYAVIARTINGSTVRHIERMGRIAQPSSLTTCRYLDSCITVSNPGTTSIPVPHLPGETVYAVADGVQKGPFTVSNGVIILDAIPTTVHIGILFTASLRSLPPVMLVEGFGKGRQMTTKEVTLRVDQSCGFLAAVYSDDGISRTAWPANGIDDTALSTKDISVPIESSFGRTAQIEISQSSPFPLTIVSMTLDVDTGGP